jgi:hypothetical protein
VAQSPAAFEVASIKPTASDGGGGMFIAMRGGQEQLGLRMQATRGPVEALAIDKVARSLGELNR